MVVETESKKDNSVEIEAYLKPSWVLASTNKTQLGFSVDQYIITAQLNLLIKTDVIIV